MEGLRPPWLSLRGAEARATVEVLARSGTPTPACLHHLLKALGPTLSQKLTASQPGAGAWRIPGRPRVSGLLGSGPFLEAPGSLGLSLPLADNVSGGKRPEAPAPNIIG